MRLFVGIELDENVRGAAADAAQQIRAELNHARVHLDARWVPAENLHLTVWFIGEVTDERASELRAVLDVPLATPVFDLGITGAGSFPPSGPPRVIWLGVARGAGSMSRLYEEVKERFVPIGLEPERRPYSPHLTIARVKDAPRGSARAVRDTLAAIPADCGEYRVDALTLFRSRTSPKGATYEPLLRVPLG